MKKRLLSILLCLVMALSLLPTVAFAAGYTAGYIAGTTGAGTQSDPVICDNFAELKAALEYAGDLYIQVDSFTNTTGLDFYALQPESDYADQNTPAISVPAGYTKDLIINTDINLRAVANPVLPTLIKVSGNLTVSGNGSISCSFGGFFTPNAVIYIFYPGNVTVNGNVRIAGVLGNRVAHACAIDNYSGYLTINGGTFSGYSPDEVAESSEDSWAVKVSDGSYSTVINGGTFSSTAADNNGKAYGLYCYNDKITISGGIFHGINAQHSECTISDFLKVGYEYYKTSDNTLFDASAVKSTTEALKVVKQTPITSVEVTPNTVTIPRNSQQQFTATVSGIGFFSNEVTWSIEGGDFGTNIDSTGLLSVAKANTENTITVKATSVADPTKYGTATVTLTSVNTYTVTYDANGGTGTMNPEICTIDAEKGYADYVFPACGFTAPEGKEFDCWTVEGITGSISPQTRHALFGDMIVKAVWKDSTAPQPTTYTVSFEMNGHGDQVAAQPVNEGAKATKPTDPTAEGWTFDGWYADDTFSAAFDFDTAIAADTTIYAKWAEKEPSVTPITKVELTVGSPTAGKTAAECMLVPTFTTTPVGAAEFWVEETNWYNRNGSGKFTGIFEDGKEYIYEIVLKCKDGYKFPVSGGEYLGTAIVNGKDAYYAEAANPNGECAFIGVVLTTAGIPAPTTYTVNVQNVGHGFASADKLSAAKGETVTLTATPAEGYHFKEWQSSDVTVNGNTFTMPEKSVTVKAIFEADTPTTPTDPGRPDWPGRPTTPTRPAAPTDITAPKTGDSSNMMLWAMLVVMSGAALCGAAVVSKKRKHN